MRLTEERSKLLCIIISRWLVDDHVRHASRLFDWGRLGSICAEDTLKQLENLALGEEMADYDNCMGGLPAARSLPLRSEPPMPRCAIVHLALGFYDRGAVVSC